MKVTISTGRSRKETHWKIKTVEWSKLVDKLRNTHRTPETTADYKAATKERRSEIKDIGGFVGGAVTGGRRVKGSVKTRTLVTLDLDYAFEDVWDDITLMFNCTMVLYSTHSHTPEDPRFRLVMPLDREVNVEEYEAIARKVAEIIGIDQFDDSTYQAERLMYYPSTSKDGQYIFEYMDGAPLCADNVLAEYRDWRDVSQWATSSRIDAVIRREMRKKGDPTTKPGVIGAFCRSYSITDAIDTFLSDVYTPVSNADNRYTFLAGTSAGGLVVYDDMFAYSHHATDPAGGQLSNAFDIIRIHKFGDMDENVTEATPITRYPSYLEMERFAANDSRVKQDLNADIEARLRSDFGDLYEQDEFDEIIAEETDPDDNSWMEQLTRDRSNKIESTSSNIILILENAKGLKGNVRRNDFTHTDEVVGNLPWRKIRFDCDREWGNDDDARLRVYLEKYYNIQGKEKILNCFTEVTTSHRHHPIREYLSRLRWDGTPRAETILIDYLGAQDTPLNRSVTRKFLAAAVSRIYNPGIKFDYVTVLQGKQGIGKSTLIAKLAGAGWFNDSMTDLNGKDAMEMLQGSWIIELGELQAIKRSDIENVKSFLSRQVDAYRPAYGRVRENHPRQCVFFATTNEQNFLKGSDGNRRFWVVSCSGNASKNVFTLDDETRNQIWAEAVQMYKSNEPLFLDESMETNMRELQATYNEDACDVRAGIIEEFLNKKLPTEWGTMDTNSRVVYLADEDDIERRGVYLRDKVCVAEIMAECFHERIDERNRYKVKDYNDLMAKIPGWKKSKSVMRFKLYGSQRGFVRVENDDI